MEQYVKAPAQQFGGEILEAGGWDLVAGFFHRGVRIQAQISHDAVDKSSTTVAMP
jgi:hypothetical protein